VSSAPSQALNNASIGLRCHDVHQGMANVDTRSAYIAEIETTRLVGMAANLAVNIRGQDVVENGEALKKIAAQELGVDGLNFRAVLDLLQEADMVTLRSIGSGRNYKIEENIPHHQNLYDRLGEVWEDRNPADVEHETVALVHALAQSPREYEDVQAAIPQADLKPILAIGEATQLIKALKLSDGTQLLYSPFFVFENPDVMREIFETHAHEAVNAVMATIRGEQGRIVDENNPVMKDMVARGLLMAPTISSAGGDASFAFLPYSVDAQYLAAKKAILDKAIQILACVRYGEHRAVATKITDPARILGALLDSGRNFTINPHSEHKRQYQTLYRLQIVDFVPSGSWVAVKLIDTDDNKEAVRLALELLRFGEEMSDRGLSDEAKHLLVHGDRYKNPMTTINDRKAQLHVPEDTWAGLTRAIRGGAIL